jgi:EspG family
VETGRPTRAYVEPSVVTIIDIPQGRLVAENTYAGGRKWMIVAPGTRSNVAAALNRLVRRLPADQEWYSYRKVV